MISLGWFLGIGILAIGCAFFSGWSFARSRKVVETEAAVRDAVVALDRRISQLESERGRA